MKNNDLDKVLKQMNSDGFPIEEEVGLLSTLVLFDKEEYMVVGRIKGVLNKDYIDDKFIKNYQNHFDDLYESQTGQTNNRYVYKKVAVDVLPDSLATLIINS